MCHHARGQNSGDVMNDRNASPVASKKSAATTSVKGRVGAQHANVKPSLHQQAAGSQETQGHAALISMRHGLEQKVVKTSVGAPPSIELSRLIDAHTLILKEARKHAEKAEDAGDSGTNGLLISNVARTNELQVWFLSEHLFAANPV
jgi:DNA-binding ferritin-like protein